MLSYIIRRFFYMIVILFVVSIVGFIIIQLPPGDYADTYRFQLEKMGQELDEEEIASMIKQFGLDRPLHIQYFNWIINFLKGNLGISFEWNAPVSRLICNRLGFTILISLCTIIFTYIVAIPIGIYSATHQYSIADYSFTTVGFVGLATPNFLLALILMFMFFKWFNISAGGLFSSEFVDAAWSFSRLWDLIKHLWVPVIVIGTAGTAGLIRVMRSCLLDELQKQYVITARAKGVSENKLLFKYPVRVAINPLISTIGWMLPAIVSGATITAIVLSLPTVGPLLYGALMAQDMYLAASIMVILSSLTVIGTFISDILLVVVDPRIRYEK